MNKAQTVLKEITDYYGVGHYFNYPDLLNHVKDNKIGYGIYSKYSHCGFYCPNNNCDVMPCIILYSDNSILVFTGYSIETYIEC